MEKLVAEAQAQVVVKVKPKQVAAPVKLLQASLLPTKLQHQQSNAGNFRVRLDFM